jgi:hypothetical protein
MRPALALMLCALLLPKVSQSLAAEEKQPEQVHSDISTREISIQSNFTGVEIVLFGSIDFSRTAAPDEGPQTPDESKAGESGLDPFQLLGALGAVCMLAWIGTTGLMSIASFMAGALLWIAALWSVPNRQK